MQKVGKRGSVRNVRARLRGGVDTRENWLQKSCSLPACVLIARRVGCLVSLVGCTLAMNLQAAGVELLRVGDPLNRDW